MKAAMILRCLGVLAIAGAAAGCVLVVDGDGVRRGGSEVEWSSGSDTNVITADPSSASGGLVRDVESRFGMDSQLSGEDISVSSSADVVTLHGRLSDISLLEHALRVAAETPGVARVVSRITVEMEVD